MRSSVNETDSSSKLCYFLIRSLLLPLLNKLLLQSQLGRSSHWRCSAKKVFLKISKNSLENTCARVTFFIKFPAKKETPGQVLSCEFCKIFKNTFSTEHLRWLLLVRPDYVAIIITGLTFRTSSNIFSVITKVFFR